MPVMGFKKFERLFRAAAEVRVDRDDIKSYLDFVEDVIYDLLITAQATAKANSDSAPETVRAGARVLAAHWNQRREFEGFWLATVKRIEPGEYTLEWFDSPEYPAFKSRPQDIAVPHPEFRVSGK